jgi:hypothetical protein
LGGIAKGSSLDDATRSQGIAWPVSIFIAPGSRRIIGFMISRPEIQPIIEINDILRFITRHHYRISPKRGGGKLKLNTRRHTFLRRITLTRERCRSVARRNNKRALERLAGAAILIRDFAEAVPKEANLPVLSGPNAAKGLKSDFFGGVDTSEKPSRRQIKGFVRILLDSLLLFRLMKRLGNSADGAQGSGPPGVS